MSIIFSTLQSIFKSFTDNDLAHGFCVNARETQYGIEGYVVSYGKREPGKYLKSKNFSIHKGAIKKCRIFKKKRRGVK